MQLQHTWPGLDEVSGWPGHIAPSPAGWAWPAAAEPTNNSAQEAA
jgi:hypothetical protein